MASIFIGGTHTGSTIGEVIEVYGGKHGLEYYQLITNDVNSNGDRNQFNIFLWDGGLSHADRFTGHWALMNEVIKHSSLRINEPLFIYGFSHGGNVALQGLSWVLSGEKVLSKITFITLATPALEEYKPPAYIVGSKDVRWVNIYHDKDTVQNFWSCGFERCTKNPQSYETGSKDISILSDYHGIKSHTNLAKSIYVYRALKKEFE